MIKQFSNQKPCLHGSLLSTVNYFKVHIFLLTVKLVASTQDSLLTSGITSKIQESGFKTTEIACAPRSLIYWQDLLLSAFTQSTTINSSALLLRNLGSKNLPVKCFPVDSKLLASASTRQLLTSLLLIIVYC